MRDMTTGPGSGAPHAAVWVVFAGFMLGGCTNAQLYDLVQSHQEMACLDQPAAAIQDCLDAARAPYEDYERKAAQVLVRPDITEGVTKTDDSRG